MQTIVLIVLFAAPALFCLRAQAVADPDVWWHMRTADWILEHHAAPYTDPFTSTELGQPWAAYSWLFELLIRKLYAAFGTGGLLGYSCGMVIAITVALHRMIRRLQTDFTFCALLTYAICFTLGRLFTPRPWLFTVLFFVIELDLISSARRSGRLSRLLWLLPLFALWSNLHIQFIDGLVVLGIVLIEALYLRFTRRAEPRDQGETGQVTALNPLVVGAILVGCLGAACVNPYGIHIYRVAYDLATQAGVTERISELQALPFRVIADFAFLVLALSSAAVLAMAKKVDLFETILFAFSTYVSFHSQRDIWVLAVVAAMILARGLEGSGDAIDRTPLLAVPLAVVLAATVVLAGFPIFKINNQTLGKVLEENLPVKAAQAIEQQGLTGPVYNDYNWGGYLMWALRRPVSIDGRANLHGTERIMRSMDTMFAQPDWSKDPELQNARLLVLSTHEPLAELLRLNSRFKLVYADKVAVVFVAATPPVTREPRTTPEELKPMMVNPPARKPAVSGR